MKKNDRFISLFIGLISCIAVSCSKNNNHFIIEGEIRDAGNKTLYLENIGASTVALLDSIPLTEDGSFRFKRERPPVPDFYRLRLGKQMINVAIDSTETITVHGNAVDFARNYTIEGSLGNEQIKELTLLQLSAQSEYRRLQKQYEAKEISMDEYVEQIKNILENYKTTARKYIYAAPMSATAYFALFQQIDQLLIFDPYDKADSKAFGAVANSWNQWYPQSPRAVQLYHIFTQSLAFFRGERPITVTEGNSKELLDITLPSLLGKDITLSAIGNGKVTLIDFTSYESKESPARNILLAEIYEKYKSKGLEIYQISIDIDEHFWKNAGVNLPWICVRDPQSTYSDVLRRYNVSQIPTSFIRNREGDIVSRIESYDQLEKNITSYLQ
jgi:hypothetical protein